MGWLVCSGQANAQQCQAEIACVLATIPMSISLHESAGKDLTVTSMDKGNFETFVAAAAATGLVETPKDKRPVTMFAPTDDAFNKLPEGMTDNLTQSENKDALHSILKYHIAAGRLEAKDDIRQSLLETANGKDVELDVTDDEVTINGAKVVKTDISCSNGVIHVIDTVILPKK